MKVDSFVKKTPKPAAAPAILPTHRAHAAHRAHHPAPPNPHSPTAPLPQQQRQQQQQHPPDSVTPEDYKNLGINKKTLQQADDADKNPIPQYLNDKPILRSLFELAAFKKGITRSWCEDKCENILCNDGTKKKCHKNNALIDDLKSTKLNLDANSLALISLMQHEFVKDGVDFESINVNNLGDLIKYHNISVSYGGWPDTLVADDVIDDRYKCEFTDSSGNKLTNNFRNIAKDIEQFLKEIVEGHDPAAAAAEAAPPPAYSAPPPAYSAA